MYICVYVCYMLYIMSHTVTSWPSPPPDPPWGTPHSTYSTYLHILYVCIYYMGYIGTYYTCAQTCWTPRISCFSGVSGGPKWGRFWAHPDLPPQIPHPIHPSCIMAPYMLICANIHTYIPYIHTITPYLHDIQPLSAIPSTMANPWIWGSGSGYGVHQMLYMP